MVVRAFVQALSEKTPMSGDVCIEPEEFRTRLELIAPKVESVKAMAMSARIIVVAIWNFFLFFIL